MAITLQKTPLKLQYICRVDFAAAPTRMSNILLEVIVPPEKPRISDENNEEVRLKLGPYRLGDTVTITCEVSKRNDSSWYQFILIYNCFCLLTAIHHAN